jgi:hypothetical protein
MQVLLICESRGLAVTAIAVGFVATWRRRAVVRLKMYAFVMILLL